MHPDQPPGIGRPIVASLLLVLSLPFLIACVVFAAGALMPPQPSAGWGVLFMPFFAIVGGGIGLIMLLSGDAVLQRRGGGPLKGYRIAESVLAGLAAVVFLSVGIAARSTLALLLALVLAAGSVALWRSNRRHVQVPATAGPIE